MAKQKTIDINGVKVPIEINNYSLILYERMRGKSSRSIEGMEDLIAIIYTGLQAGAELAGLEFKMGFDDFIKYTVTHNINPESFMDGSADDGKKK